MNTYEILEQKIIGLAFILGPLTLLISVMVLILGIGVDPFGNYSWVGGFFEVFAFLFMIPIFFKLAQLLGKRAPLMGIAGAILGLAWGFSVIPAAAKLIQMDIIAAGLNESIWNVMGTGQSAAWIPIFLGSILSVILTPLLFGIGFLWKGGASRLTAVMLIVGGILHFLGIGGGAEIAFWQTHIAKPLGSVAYIIALFPIGFQILVGTLKTDTLDVATA